jgi:hypothetical protein
MAERNKSFYHGTIEHIPEGSTITPRTKSGWAFATTDLNGAISHTQTRIGTGMGKGDQSQSVNHGKIYEVEPIEGDETFSKADDSGISGAVASKKGFKVTRQIASVLKESDNG